MAKWRSKVSETIMRTEAHMETCAITSEYFTTVERWSGKHKEKQCCWKVILNLALTFLWTCKGRGKQTLMLWTN